MDVLRIKMHSAQDMDAIEEAINGALKGIWTSLPVIVAEDSDGHIAKAQSAVRLAITQLDGSVKMVSFPPFDTSPVHYPNGGGHHFTHPVKKDDEGVIHFMSRAQDLWHQKGGEQDPIDNRTHHLADSRYEPGGRSDPRKLNPAPSKVSAQQRSDDGNHVSDVNKDSGITHASTKKHLVSVGGANGAGTIHIPGKIIKNAAKVLINSVSQSPLPPPGETFANRKKVATIPIGAMGSQAGAISAIMGAVMNNGIGALLSSPTAAASSALTGAISSATSAIAGLGAGTLTSALGGMASAVTALEGAVATLSGATLPGGGGLGLSDVLSHAESLSQFFGATPPASVSLAAVLAPLQSAPTLTMIAGEVAALTDAFLHGSTSEGAATATVAWRTGQIAALAPAALAAMTTLQTALPALQLAVRAGSAGVSFDPNELAIAGALRGGQLAALTNAMASIFALGAAEVASIQAFPDPAGDGARGGVPLS